MKKTIALVLALVTLMGCAAFAITGRVMPRYTFISDASSSLYISGSTAESNAPITVYADVSRIQCFITLEKQSGSTWTPVKNTNETVYNTRAYTFVQTATGLSNGTYRAKATYYAYAADGRYDTVTTYSATVTK